MSAIRRVRHGALLLPVLALVMLACGGSSTATEPPDGGGDPDATEAGSTLAPAGARSFFTYDARLGRLVRVDPDTGDVAELTDLEGAVYAMDQGEGSYWLGLDSGAVARVDQSTGEVVAEIPPAATDGLFDLAVGDGAAWVLHGIPGAGTSLVRIDTATNTAGEPVAAGTGISFYDIEAGDGAVWLVGTSPTMATTLYAVDPATGVPTDLEVQMIIDAIAVGDGAVWLAGSFFPDGTVGVPGIGRYDSATKELTTIELPAEPGSIAVGSGAVWGVTGIGADGLTAYRIDPATMTLAATIPLGEAEGGRVKVSTGAGAVWVTTDGGEAFVIDPADDSVAGSGDSLSTLGLFFP